MAAFTIIHQEEEDCRQLTHEITGHACKFLLLFCFCCLHYSKLNFLCIFFQLFLPERFITLNEYLTASYRLPKSETLNVCKKSKEKSKNKKNKRKIPRQMLGSNSTPSCVKSHRQVDLVQELGSLHSLKPQSAVHIHV